ncbi:MAG: hypothetical protein MUC51_13430, partial [Anaerolineae bacterium]|nr:hypothetical protein [Anaerolineae bacterium]
MRMGRRTTDDGQLTGDGESRSPVAGRRSSSVFGLPSIPDLSIIIIGLASVLGVAAFLYPFFLPSMQNAGGMAHAN